MATAGGGHRAAECLLIREDGTRWTVESLELSRRRFRVTARRREGQADIERLDSEPLTPEDELRWLDEDGQEVARVRGADR
jgi:hypothetical protein